MESTIEERVWRMATRLLGSHMQTCLEDALETFKRVPGFDELTRLHGSEVGEEGACALRNALTARGIRHRGAAGGYVEIRSRLRLHLRRHLQSKLIQAGKATEAMSEDYFAHDLGL